MDIPGDIMRAAGDAILKAGQAYYVGGDIHTAVARALLAERERATQAERERCAKIAERATVDVKARGVDGVRAAPIPNRSEIAAAIRTPSTGEET